MEKMKKWKRIFLFFFCGLSVVSPPSPEQFFPLVFPHEFEYTDQVLYIQMYLPDLFMQLGKLFLNHRVGRRSVHLRYIWARAFSPPNNSAKARDALH